MTQLVIETDADVEVAAQATRVAAVAAGLPAPAAADFAVFAGQAARALLIYGQGRGGALSLREVQRRVAGAAVPGVELCVTCEDRPRPSFDPDRGVPLLDLTSSPLTDEVDVDLRLGEDLRLLARRFVTPQERRSEVAVLGRAAPGERVSGDDAAFLRLPDRLVLCLADGLGKGAPAREAARRAVACVGTDERTAPDDPAQLLALADRALQGTRGAVMAAAIHPFGGGALQHAGAGDTSALVATARGQRRLLCTAHVLGAPPPRRRPFPAEQVEAQPGDLLILYTDGLVSRVTLPEYSTHPAFLRQHPLQIASALLSRFTRGHDDALVLVSRL